MMRDIISLSSLLSPSPYCLSSHVVSNEKRVDFCGGLAVRREGGGGTDVSCHLVLVLLPTTDPNRRTQRCAYWQHANQPTNRATNTPHMCVVASAGQGEAHKIVAMVILLVGCWVVLDGIRVYATRNNASLRRVPSWFEKGNPTEKEACGFCESCKKRTSNLETRFCRYVVVAASCILFRKL